MPEDAQGRCCEVFHSRCIQSLLVEVCLKREHLKVCLKQEHR
jgi:hypothetical protein